MTGTSVTTKVLALPGAFDAQNPELTLSELARRAEVSVPTAHRRAAWLVEWGALEKTSAGRYRIGLRLWEVASLAPRAPGPARGGPAVHGGPVRPDPAERAAGRP